jgi:hypothetical protein
MRAVIAAAAANAIAANCNKKYNCGSNETEKSSDSCSV